jgi:hypothetical protein
MSSANERRYAMPLLIRFVLGVRLSGSQQPPQRIGGLLDGSGSGPSAHQIAVFQSGRERVQASLYHGSMSGRFGA